MHLLRGVGSNTTHDEMIPLLYPLENGAGSNSEPAPHFGWNGYLALSGDLGGCKRHEEHITAVMSHRQGRRLDLEISSILVARPTATT
jgi:hypothetical protein